MLLTTKYIYNVNFFFKLRGIIICEFKIRKATVQLESDTDENSNNVFYYDHLFNKFALLAYIFFRRKIK